MADSISRTIYALASLVAIILSFSVGPETHGADRTPEMPEDLEAFVSRINEGLDASWRRHGVKVTPLSSDEEFFRRIWLDLAGVAPPAARVRAFVRDDSGDKRGQAIDELLASPRHAAHMANVWQNILLPEGIVDDRNNNAGRLREWLRNQFVNNVGYDHFVASFLTAGGESSSGPAAFYASLDVEPKKLAGATSQIFLGQQLKCAECHDHPFDRWSQRDFWSFTAFFGQLERKEQGGKVYIEDTGSGEVMLPDTDEVVEPAYPGGDLPEWDPDNNRRRQLTIWLASRDNPYLGRAIVNRTWAHLFGRGQIEPIDAMDQKNSAVQPEVFDAVVEDFTESRFNTRRLLRILMRTTAYQLTSETVDEGTAGSSEEDEDEAVDPESGKTPRELFASMTVKTLTAEQFYDSLLQNVIRSPGQNDGGNPRFTDAQRTAFLSRMRTSGGTSRDYPHGVVQALGLMNGPEISMGVNLQSSGLLRSLDAPFFDDAQRIETLFLATLSRMPRSSESERFANHLANSTDRSAALSDMLWALLNSSEFAICP